MSCTCNIYSNPMNMQIHSSISSVEIREMAEDCGDCCKWEQDIYWTHFQSIMFFKALPQGFDEQLAIPEKFARNMKKKLPENVTIVGPSGAKWNVGLDSSGDTLLLKIGWKKFVEDHVLQKDDLLIFRYNGESQFDVLIFNRKSSCERESSYFVRKCGHDTELDGGFRTKINMEESPAEGGCNSSVCVGECTPSKRPRDNDNLKFAPSVAEDRPVMGYSLQYVSNRRPVTEEEKKNALQMARAASTPGSCIIVMQPSHVYWGFFLSIPDDWVLSQLPRKSEDVTLRVKGKEKTWHARYSGRVCTRARGLSGGWMDFAFDNNLEESDVCLLKLASGNHDGIVLDVSIFRVVPEVSPLTQLVPSP